MILHAICEDKVKEFINTYVYKGFNIFEYNHSNLKDCSSGYEYPLSDNSFNECNTILKKVFKGVDNLNIVMLTDNDIIPQWKDKLKEIEFIHIDSLK